VGDGGSQRRDEYNRHGRSASGEGKWIKGKRYSLLKDTAKQTAGQLLKLAEVVLTNKRMYRAFLLYGELRYIYRLRKHEAPERLDAWLAWASRSRLKPFVKLARTIRQHNKACSPRSSSGSATSVLHTAPPGVVVVVMPSATRPGR
jgi:transposase